MTHLDKNSLLVTIKGQDGQVIAVFVCMDESELDKLNNAEHLRPPVLVNVKDFRMFLGNAVIIPVESNGFTGDDDHAPPYQDRGGFIPP